MSRVGEGRGRGEVILNKNKIKITNKVICYFKWSGYMREERKVVVELLEAEQMNTYKVLAEFLARKFLEKGFDTEEEK